MAANATTKIQVNYGKDGILVNVYADNQGELETLLASVQDLSSLINSVNGSLRSLPAVVSAPPTAQSVEQQFNTPPVAPSHPVVVEGQAPTCKHGTMAFRNGTSARGPWRAWMCAAPKGAVDKCEPIFLK
jgi:hypothetical protein